MSSGGEKRANGDGDLTPRRMKLSGTRRRLGRAITGPRPAVDAEVARPAAETEVDRLRRENAKLRDQLRRAHAPRRQATTPGAPVEGDLVGNRFLLDRLLAKGGMATVWVACDLDTSEDVAVKFLDDSADEEAIGRFRREAELCAALQSEHIVRLLDHGTHGDRHYIAMELLRGESLSSLLRRRGRLELPEACHLALDLERALAPAHAAGIVHRDLKPPNLFLSIDDHGRRILKILDFGIARSIGQSSEMTQTGMIIGSPNYMSPEQARGERSIDHRSDLWSVAVILYRAITGVRPWGGDSPLEVLARMITESPQRVSQLRGDASPALNGFFEKAFASDPDHRYQSIEALTHAFVAAAACNSEPPTVRADVRSGEPSQHGQQISPLHPAPAIVAQPIRHPPPPPPKRSRLELTTTMLFVAAVLLAITAFVVSNF